MSQNSNGKSSKKTLLYAIGTLLFLLFTLIIGVAITLKPTSNSTFSAELTLLPGITNTPIISTSTPTIIPSPTIGIRPSPLPGTIGIGGYIQVFGTNGTSLNIRKEAGLNGVLVFQALDGELFVIIDGPKSVDGYTWWKIQSSVESDRIGWAVDNYLAPISR